MTKPCKLRTQWMVSNSNSVKLCSVRRCVCFFFCFVLIFFSFVIFYKTMCNKTIQIPFGWCPKLDDLACSRYHNRQKRLLIECLEIEKFLTYLRANHSCFFVENDLKIFSIFLFVFFFFHTRDRSTFETHRTKMLARSLHI